MNLVLLVFLLYAPGLVIIARGQIQVAGFKVLKTGDYGQCPSVEKRERAINEIDQSINLTMVATLPTSAPASAIPTLSTMTSEITVSATDSTNAMSVTASASVVSVPATTPATSMPTTASVTIQTTMTDCGGPGWRRVAFINMTDTNYNCPTGLNLTSHSKRTCGRSHTTYGGCSSATFSVGDLPYSCVCGRIRGYQVGTTGGFGYRVNDIDNYYVDGVSLTHGDPGSRQHIWTFAAGVSEVTTSFLDYGCPCDTAPPSVVPAFVGNDYFCESGLHSEWSNSYLGMLFPGDVLWDGQGCTSNSTCCQFNNPPWFTKNLTSATTDDIELRICTDCRPACDDVPIELIELYVQ